ncbi:MAG: site-specific DNA recombinase [Paracoccaceae bacterium]|jgi:DNA invertase Pin-like site-specific DNA recombinase
MKKIRCAIYTRKSSEDGLEQEFNSLDAQREACASYVASQKHEGWVLLPNAYDDGGLSGGSLERPTLQRLMQDMRDGLVDQIIVYKIDRLTRSLADFSKIVDVLDAAGASFVSVTQSFNTATSMGRLTLNMLLSFAQFEREVTAERIRDKIAASKRKGLWMGGLVPIGYDADGRTLSINEDEAATIRTLYDLYETHQTVRVVKEHADFFKLQTKVRTAADGTVRGGGPFARGHVHHILTNPLYAGRIRHRKVVHEGQHPALIESTRWDHIQAMLQDGAAKDRRSRSKSQSSLLCGKLFDETGDRLTPSHTKTRLSKRLRYYISHRLIAKSGEKHLDGWRLPAPELEAQVAALTRKTLTDASAVTRLMTGASSGDIGNAQAVLTNWLATATQADLLSLARKITIEPGQLTVQIDQNQVADILETNAETLNEDALSIGSVFQIRKRGVETKLIFADVPIGQDDALIRNIAKAHTWFEQMKAGKSFAQIADAEKTSKRRVQQMIDLAFLAPDIVRDALEGKQPIRFTSDWCLRHALPSDWDKQRQLLKNLN